MVGLDEIKNIVNDIIYTSKINKIRSERGLNNNSTSKHMIFTGNPGSAKTTVARLVAAILRLEGILETGVFIECGRADLVGKYVGWTARIVREKFRAASGGVLFIDEAYSLVDNGGSFGTEAINTIVQEMENHRNDVIVIFAGYKDSMEQFLDSNEGLRSRIAFHLDFPDYNPEEMLEILKLMSKNSGYTLSPDALSKCHDIFKNACENEEFGNGRFARNLLEQAEMSQAKRLYSENKHSRLTNEKLSTLIAEDFETNIGGRYKEKK